MPIPKLELRTLVGYNIEFGWKCGRIEVPWKG